MLIACPDCGKKISSAAAFCPNCGYPGPFAVDGAEAAPVPDAGRESARTLKNSAPSVPSAAQEMTGQGKNLARKIGIAALIALLLSIAESVLLIHRLVDSDAGILVTGTIMIVCASIVPLSWIWRNKQKRLA
ncbi:MAG: zinc ribbon domain-containing protein [Zoogloeaceae bacterium]|nr:zinc ribbon domain-containing protein [Zoogloeaceae bacterium]